MQVARGETKQKVEKKAQNWIFLGPSGLSQTKMLQCVPFQNITADDKGACLRLVCYFWKKNQFQFSRQIPNSSSFPFLFSVPPPSHDFPPLSLQPIFLFATLSTTILPPSTTNSLLSFRFFSSPSSFLSFSSNPLTTSRHYRYDSHHYSHSSLSCHHSPLYRAQLQSPPLRPLFFSSSFFPFLLSLSPPFTSSVKHHHITNLNFWHFQAVVAPLSHHQ